MPQEEKEFDERVVHIDRVARVVKGGRRFRFRALVVIGDHKNRVGIGTAKGADVTAAVSKAVDVAKKNLVTIPIYKGTLPHEAEAKVSGAHILVKPASAGTGLIAGGVVRTVLEVGGVHNALSKSLGSSNKINTAYATLKALQSIEPSRKWVTTPQVASSNLRQGSGQAKQVAKEATAQPKEEVAKADAVDKPEKEEKEVKKTVTKKAPTKKAATAKEAK
jgi:small subunit ribosomal protein S5